MNPADTQKDVVSLPDHCLRRGIPLRVKNGESGYYAAKGAMIEETMSTVRARKNDILRYMTQSGESRFRVAAASGNRAPLFNRFLWKDYSNRVMEISSANAPHIVMRCSGEILTDALLRSIDILLERHDVLNSSIEMAGGNLYLVCRAKKPVAFREIVVSGKTPREREDNAYRIANGLVWEEYDLDNGPLYRVFLIRLSAVDYIFGVALHHAIGDMISIGIMYRELFSIYCSVVFGTPLMTPPARLRYMDYLASMESWSKSSACEEHIRYWKVKLGSAPVTDLPRNGNRPLDGTALESTAEAKLLFDAETTSGLKKIAVQLKTTLFTVLLTIYKIALWRMTGQEELLVVVLHAGRFDAGFQNAIGDFALEVACKTCLAGNPGFTEAAGRVTRAMNEAVFRQPVPFDWIRRALAKDGISFCAPGINFTSGDTRHTRDPLEPRPLKFIPPGVKHGCNGFPVSFAVEFHDRGDVIEGSMVYRNAFYDEETINTFLNCFTQTAAGVIRFPCLGSAGWKNFTGSMIWDFGGERRNGQAIETIEKT